MRKILVVAPHPDDETLGCGGALLKHKSCGDELYWLIVTGLTKDGGYKTAAIRKRQLEIERVSAAYAFSGVFRLGFPTTALDVLSKAEMVKSVGDVIARVKPEIIYMPHRGDVHSDHTVTAEAVVSASKTFRAPFIKKILSYEVVSETEFAAPCQAAAFIPNSFTDITGFLEQKLEIMKIYEGELFEHPFPRSLANLKALATFRGATAGSQYAEAFMLMKEIW